MPLNSRGAFNSLTYLNYGKQMQKYYCILFFTFFLWHEVAAQPIKSGIITYSVQALEVDQSDSKNAYVDLSPFSSSIVKQIKFSLAFDDKVSTFDFIDNKEIKLDERALATTLAYHLDYAGTIWQDDQNSYVETNIGFGEKSKRVLLLRDKEESEWHISDETKYIGDFLCIKATKEDTLKRGEKTVVKPAIAWFCPELPIPYGPLNYGNLPGLIMELQTDRAIFGLLTIEFKEISIKDRPALPLYTEQEVINAWKEMAGIK